MTRDDSKPLDRDLRALLDVEGASVVAPDEARARVLHRVAGTLGLPWREGSDPTGDPPGANEAGQLGDASPPTDALSRTRVRARASWPVALAALGATFALGAMTGVLVWRAEHPPQAPRIVYVDRVQPAPSAQPPAQDAVVVAPAPSGLALSRAAPPSSSVAVSTLGDERALLDVARSAFGRGQSDEALAALARHERLFPDGQLDEEREALAVRALVMGERGDAARARAARFRRRYPGSVMLPAVEAALGTLR